MPLTPTLQPPALALTRLAGSLGWLHGRCEWIMVWRTPEVEAERPNL